METAHDLSPLNVRLVQLMQIVVSSYGGLKPHLPALPTHFSMQVRYILMDCEKQQGRKLKFSNARQDLNRVYLFANNYQLPNKLLAIYNISACEDKNS